MSEPKNVKERRAVRSTVSKVVTDIFDEDYLRELAVSVKGLTKGVWGEGACAECGSQKKVKVEVPDLATQIKVLAELLEQAEGRPGVAEGEAAGMTIIVERPNLSDGTPNPIELSAA